MLDLQKLEQQLDAALANETPESLTSWLLSQRMVGTLSQIEAQEAVISVVNSMFRPNASDSAKFVDTADADVAGLYDYAMAA